VMSHPQALGQSRKWLRARGMRPVSYADTAAAAALVAEVQDWSVAAIAPAFAAPIYGLDVLARDIADEPDNMTRFLVLAPELREPAASEGMMTTFVFEVNNVPAALYKALGSFATNGVNMTKLESYQRGASFAATEFYTDIEGAPGDPAIDRAIEELRFHAKRVDILGVYPQARKRG
jgi:prephenate dehydratase